MSLEWMERLAEIYDESCVKRFPSTSESELEQLEDRLGRSFPEDYRAFLLEFNGGAFKNLGVECGQRIIESYGLECLKGVNVLESFWQLGTKVDLALFDDNDPLQILPIGRTNDGSLFLIDLVVEEDGFGNIFYKKIFGDFYYVCDSFAEFVQLFAREPWLKY